MDKASQEMIKGLLEKARGKLTAAEDWLAQGKYFDEIASRCYYAAFHAAQALLLTEGLTADTHQGVVSLFGLHFAKTGKVNPRLGRYLNLNPAVRLDKPGKGRPQKAQKAQNAFCFFVLFVPFVAVPFLDGNFEVSRCTSPVG